MVWPLLWRGNGRAGYQFKGLWLNAIANAGMTNQAGWFGIITVTQGHGVGGYSRQVVVLAGVAERTSKVRSRVTCNTRSRFTEDLPFGTTCKSHGG
jgi:hypothetical protein